MQPAFIVPWSSHRPHRLILHLHPRGKKVWRTADSLRRSSSEWESDVTAVFRGFDTTRTGFITTEDFALALDLLNAPVGR